MMSTLGQVNMILEIIQCLAVVVDDEKYMVVCVVNTILPRCLEGCPNWFE